MKPIRGFYILLGGTGIVGVALLFCSSHSFRNPASQFGPSGSNSPETGKHLVKSKELKQESGIIGFRNLGKIQQAGSKAGETSQRGSSSDAPLRDLKSAQTEYKQQKDIILSHLGLSDEQLASVRKASETSERDMAELIRSRPGDTKALFELMASTNAKILGIMGNDAFQSYNEQLESVAERSLSDVRSAVQRLPSSENQ